MQHKEITLKETFQSESGAIDLASIMVGIIVIGMIGGVIAATVFAIIPWSQDNAAKQQLDSVVAAESAYMGLSSTNPPSLPAGLAGNSYGSSAELETAGLLKTGSKYCASTTNTGSKSYEAFARSSSGKIFVATDKATKPVIFTGTLPTDCQFVSDGAASPSSPATPPAYVDPTPTLTILTYKCDDTRSGTLPLETNLTGTETWDDGTSRTYTNAATNMSKTLDAGVTYKVTFDGTYNNFTSEYSGLENCLRSVDHWGANTGVTSARFAFTNANKLVAVPAVIPSGITDMGYMFFAATSFNQPINGWDVSKVTNMGHMFYGATIFNQDLSSWKTGNVTTMAYTFAYARAFNQPIGSWDTSNVATMHSMFNTATVFNQNIKTWNVAKVTGSTNFRTNSALTAANSPF